MTSHWPVENQARRIPDSVAKLRSLRRAASVDLVRRQRRAQWELGLALILSVTLLSPPAKPRNAPIPLSPPRPSAVPSAVFIVEETPSRALYSNGLQILSNYVSANTPRIYRALDRATLQPQPVSVRPAGIVFHTTESLVAPIEPGESAALNRNRGDVLAHVRRGHLYNFVIDRFGEVYRVVPEDQVAYHAGNSVWADAGSIYINLNESFLGVAFEMRAGETATAAQRHAGNLLTAMLRSQFGIPDGNCATHAQVSVNPDNLRIGYHTDWGSGFPFAEMGLSAGYRSRIPAVELFGFGYDEHFLNALGGRPWEGLLASEQQILIDAAAHGTLGPRYRTAIQQHFQTLRRHQRD